MKKIPAVLMLSVFFVFSMPGQTFFRSDPAGSLFEIITESQKEIEKFAAELIIEGDDQIINLYSDNEQYAAIEKKILEDGYHETMYQKKYKIYSRNYSGGLIVSEQLFIDNEISENRSYTYNSSGFPVLVNAVDINDIFLYIDSFFYHSSGRLLQVRRTWHDESYEMISYSYDNSGMLIRIYEHYSDISSMKNYSDNKFISVTNWENEEIKSDNIWVYNGSSSTFFEKNMDSGIEKQYEYNSSGLLVKTVEKLDVFLKITDYTYENVNLSEKTARSPGLIEKWIYAYDNDNKTSKISYFKNGVRIKETEYIDDDIMIEKLYKNGIAFLKITFKEGVRIKQEYLE